MYIEMIGKNGHTSWYRKQGEYAFDFVLTKTYATDLTAEEATKVIEHTDFYLNMYGAKCLIVEE